MKKDFLALEDFKQSELQSILDKSANLKKKPYHHSLRNKTLISIFFNPSTRTKTSFDLAMSHLGGHNIVLEPGKSSWGIEIEEGAVMDQDAEEHLKDATRVLERYADILALRCFPKFQNWQEDRQDRILKNMARWSAKPIINMETITHPCQALAMIQTLQEKYGSLKGKKCALTWAYHPKGLNTAVANSALVAASMFGMHVNLANPKEYNLDPYYTSLAEEYCQSHGTRFIQTHSMEEAFEEADFIYVKSWGSLEHYGPHFDEALHRSYKDWIVTGDKLKAAPGAFISHCLPLRRNMLITDEVIDSTRSLIYDEAENRLHVQKAIISHVLGVDYEQ